MMHFNVVTNQLSVLEIPLKGTSYTWSNIQDIHLFERLDWFFISEAWTISYSNTLAIPLAKTISYHTPCVIPYRHIHTKFKAILI